MSEVQDIVSDAIARSEQITLEWVLTIIQKYPTHVIVPELEKRIKELKESN